MRMVAKTALRRRSKLPREAFSVRVLRHLGTALPKVELEIALIPPRQVPELHDRAGREHADAVEPGAIAVRRARREELKQADAARSRQRVSPGDHRLCFGGEREPRS